MQTNELEDFDSINEEVEEVEETTEEEETVAEEPEVDLQKEIDTLKAQKEHWKKKATQPKEEVEPSSNQSSDLSTKDLYALMQSSVAEEDISEVTDYAKFKGVSVSEALKTTFVKSLLQENSEKRKVAEATHTGTSKRTNKQVAGDVLVANASKGELPKSDEDLNRLILARKGLLK